MPKFLYADLKEPGEYGVTSLVAFGMKLSYTNGEDAGIAYLVIRYTDYEKGIAEGDHLLFSLEEVFEDSYEVYGIAPKDWRPLSSEEIAVIDASIN